MSKTSDWADFVEREGLLYKESTDIPFTGEVTDEEQGKIEDGMRDGPWVKYHPNGGINPSCSAQPS